MLDSLHSMLSVDVTNHYTQNLYDQLHQIRCSLPASVLTMEETTVIE